MTTTKSRAEYKWSHPQEWLEDLFHNRTKAQDYEGIADLLQAILSSGKLDGDDIREIFQDDMDADGYFQPLAGPIIAAMSRERVIELLAGASIECRDHETTAELRHALAENVEDGTIPHEALGECAARPHRQDARGGVVHIDTCACGAMRRTESNGRTTNRGPWVRPQ